MDSFRLDLRYAWRALLHRPGFAALAILTLGIGLGVNTVAFSALNALLLHPFDIEGSGSLGWIMTGAPGNPHGQTSLPDYQDLARSTRAFDAIIAEGRLPVSYRDGSRPADQAWALLVSVNYLSVMHVRPETGRLFTDADLHGSELPAIVSHRFWVDRLGGGASLDGRSITLNGRSFSVIGVLRDDYQGPGGLFAPDVWIPLERMDVLGAPAALTTRQDGWLTLVGHLAPGATAAQAATDLQNVFAQLAADHPETNAGRSGAFYPMRDGHPDLKAIAPLAWIALGVVSMVLLIACFNVAGLLLARAAERQREIGVRAALGASRARIVRQLITEGTLLALLGGAAALVLAAWSGDLLSAFSLPAPIPQRLHLGIDARLVGFTALMVVIAGVLPALIPAVHATRADLLRAMKAESSGGGRRSRTRSLFVVAQVAGSTLFLAAALIFVRSFLNTAAFHPGFDTAHTIVLELSPSTYGYDAARGRTFFESLTARIQALPGVERAALADRVPFYVGFPRSVEVSTDGTNCAAADCRRATVYAVGPGHFNALGIPIRSGRDFTAQDIKTGNAVVVSEQMAAQFWPGANPIGQALREGPAGHQVEVIGVARDIKHRNMAERPAPFLYRSLGDADYAGPLTVVVRTTGDPRLLLGAVEDQVSALDPAIPARSARTMTQRMEMPLWPARTAAGFFLICGTLALVLATVGLFGVTYYAVSQRTREFGIRVALGATPRRVVGLVLREGLLLALPGVALGIAGALAAGRLAGSVLFGIGAADPATLAAAAVVEAAVALAACALPAQRATRADPMIALRQE